MDKIKLNRLNPETLEQIKGGKEYWYCGDWCHHTCGCGCNYEGTPNGSSTSANYAENVKWGYTSTVYADHVPINQCPD